MKTKLIIGFSLANFLLLSSCNLFSSSYESSQISSSSQETTSSSVEEPLLINDIDTYVYGDEIKVKDNIQTPNITDYTLSF